ncbi:hypothetical protein Poli38472_010968 [Pythium oligandrum]|uniref:MARVEL domain-containing protein n=1 Tax=Pythium oligandrum TaxID=41045 RepID=A0A8K1FFQ1_PYTOL|nr:hypothetical protein Poli38472_010968 [Pythium oligandrum]|eukprot:TMW61905.1 hypothetical protein Poli38472_010968 [Pythium oligandrum]
MAPLSKLQLGVRGLQSASGLAAIIFTSLGYIELKSGQLSSSAAIFAYVTNYTAILAGLYYIVALHWLQLSRSSVKVVYARVVDLLIAVLLAISGVVHTNSEAYRNCDAINNMFETYHNYPLFRCGSMSVGVIVTFVTAGLFAATLAMSFKKAAPATALATEEEPSAARDYAPVSTPTVTKPTDGAAVSAEVYHPRLRTARLSGRGLQFICASIALVFTVLGYRRYYTGQYLNPKSAFAILITYTCMLYSLWHLVVVEKLKLTRRPKLSVERTIDGVLALLLLVAGIIVASSLQIQECDETNENFSKSHGETLFRCGSMSTGMVFSFIAIVMYAGTLGLSYVRGAQEENLRDSMLTVGSNVDASVQA